MPRDDIGKADTLQWFIAALNSVEMVTVPWWYINLSKPAENPLADWMRQRFDRMEAVLQSRDWLAAARFTIADLMMADVLRMPDKLGELADYPALQAYVARVCSRPAFQKAYSDQMSYFEMADAARSKGQPESTAQTAPVGGSQGSILDKSLNPIGQVIDFYGYKNVPSWDTLAFAPAGPVNPARSADPWHQSDCPHEHAGPLRSPRDRRGCRFPSSSPRWSAEDRPHSPSARPQRRPRR